MEKDPEDRDTTEAPAETPSETPAESPETGDGAEPAGDKSGTES